MMDKVSSQDGADIDVAAWIDESPGVTRSHKASARLALGVAAVEFLVVTATAFLAFVAYHGLVYKGLPNAGQYLWTSLLLAGLFGAACLADNQYDLIGSEWTRHGVSRSVGAIAVAFTLFLTISFVTGLTQDYSRGTFLTQLALVLPAVIVTRTMLTQGIEQARRAKRIQSHGLVVVVIGESGQTSGWLDKLAARPEEILSRHELDPAASAEATEQRLAAIRDRCRSLRADTVLVVFDSANLGHITRLVTTFSELPIRIQLLPVGLANFMQRSRVGENGQVRVLEIFCRPLSVIDRALKRCFDLLVASVATVALSPLLVIVAIAVKLETPGPVFFRQMRHGFNDEPIEVIKFRTMRTCQEPEFRQATQNDPRVTRVGRVLRRTNIDELPQLFNVLRGDMSIVGPRPHAIAHNNMFANQIRMMSRRHNVKPGITGLAQVNGLRGETDTCEKMRRRVDLDLYYIDNWSLLLDVKIVFMTVLSKRAYLNAY